MNTESSQQRLRFFVDTSVRIISARLVTAVGLDQGSANELARDVVHDICAEHSSAYMYVPKDMEYTLTKRDREIYTRLKRGNVHSLAAEFNVSYVRIYQIVDQVRRQEMRLRQGRLPGFDDIA